VEGATTGAFHWFAAFSQDATDFQELAKVKLKMPVLTLGSEYFAAPFLGKHIGLVANNVKAVTITDSGHWVVQEQTEQVLKAMKDFYIEK
jgi:pimeloyl-ACP methyl ester carboxylesterase